MLYTSHDFGLKVEKTIERVKKLDTKNAFYLAHLDENGCSVTVFGTGDIMFAVPMEIGKEENMRTGYAVYQMITRKWKDDATQRALLWVPLPKAGDIGKVGTRKNPELTDLAATGMGTDGAQAMYPFCVQAAYLKTALQLAPFAGHRDTRTIYNPLYLWTKDDEGSEILGVIMPYVRKEQKDVAKTEERD